VKTNLNIHFKKMENDSFVLKELISQEAELQNQIFELNRGPLSLKDFEESKHLIRQKIETLRKKINVR
jgi:hypothetical protein